MDYQTQSFATSGIKTIPTVGYLAVYNGDAQEVFCLDVRDKFYADTASTLAADGISIITRVLGGRWHRRCQSDIYWQSQSELWLDASAGNDSATGAFGFPIKTIGEFYRRTSGNQSQAAGLLYTAATLSNSEQTLFYQFTANNGRQWELVDGSLPFTPVLRFSSRDINANGDLNKGFVDGTAYGVGKATWKNLGSGVSGDAPLQASTITYRANGLTPAGRAAIPAFEFNGAAYFKTGAVAGITGPSTWLVVFKQTSGAATNRIVDGISGANFAGLETLAGATPQIIAYAGASSNLPTITLNQFHGKVVGLNLGSPAAAQSVSAWIDGQMNLGSGVCGTNAAFGATIGAWGDGSFPHTGQILEVMLIDGAVASTDPSAWAQWIKYNFGVLPV
jgi:hypothetical protein